jgi:hypothetical protein
MHTSTQNQAQAHAAAVAEMLEQQLSAGDPAEFNMIEDILELKANTEGALFVVLTLGGPHVELVLGEGSPRIEVWWGGSHGTTHVNLDEQAVEAFVETWWRPTMEAALNE